MVAGVQFIAELRVVATVRPLQQQPLVATLRPVSRTALQLLKFVYYVGTNV